MLQTERIRACARWVTGLLVGAFIVICSACGGGGGGPTPEQRAAAEKRRASLTPEQRATEDKAKAEAEEKAKAEEEQRKEASKFDDLKSEAGVRSKTFVLKFLKHPDDASFGFWAVPEVKANPSHDAFWCSSTVKAKNDFGAELTYQWETCLKLDGDTWRLVSCSIDGKAVYLDAQLANGVISSGNAEREKAMAEGIRQAFEERAADAKHQAVIEKAKWHKWTTADGDYTVEAKFVKMTGGVVSLEKRNGTVVEVPKEKLSDDYIDWIAHRRWLD